MSDRIFIAGSALVGPIVPALMERRAAMQRAAAVLAWFGDEAPTDPRYWADMLFAKTLGCRVFMAESGTVSLATGYVGVAESMFHDCVDLTTAIALATAVADHDPKREYSGTRYSKKLAEMVGRCASPIEARLLVHLFPELVDRSACELRVQHSVLGGRYRLDFAITNEGPVEFDPDVYRPVKIAIEADGHEFHERTKEQAGRDKARDRALAADGWTILRFTGSEIWADPGRCAREVAIIAEKRESGEP